MNTKITSKGNILLQSSEFHCLLGIVRPNDNKLSW